MGEHMDPENDLRSIGISPRERLERIEKLLTVVDEKLDNKADASAVLALALRVAAIEQNEAARTAAEKVAFREEEKNRELLRVEVDELRRGHQEITRRLAYYAGGLAVLVFTFEWVFRYLT